MIARATAIAALLAVAMHGASAAERGFSVHDGDSFRVTIRLANIDAPELNGACERERRQAEQARRFTDAWLSQGKVVITQTGVDRYGRILATVSRDGSDLGLALVNAGLARPWEGRRRPWC